MIIELRRYQIVAHKRSEFWENYRKNGLPIQMRYLDEPIGFYFTDIGDLCEFVHIWRYKNHKEREEKRAALHDDERWDAYVKTALPFITSMKTSILRQLEH